jgi:hypothetical protein
MLRKYHSGPFTIYNIAFRSLNISKKNCGAKNYFSYFLVPRLRKERESYRILVVEKKNLS